MCKACCYEWDNPFPHLGALFRLFSRWLLKHFGRSRNCSWWAISNFATIFSTTCTCKSYTNFYKDFPYFFYNFLQNRRSFSMWGSKAQNMQYLSTCNCVLDAAFWQKKKRKELLLHNVYCNFPRYNLVTENQYDPTSSEAAHIRKLRSDNKHC